jgi:peptide/nickel transport system substrate-binding protein
MKAIRLVSILAVLLLLISACAPAAPTTAPVEAPAGEEPAAQPAEERTGEPTGEGVDEAVDEPAEEPTAEVDVAEVPAGRVECEFDLAIGSNGDGAIVNPILVVDTDGEWRTDMMFDSLVNLDPTTLEPIPHLAESWEVSDDGLTYTFNLTDADVRWHDGEPFTVEDIEFTLMEILKPTYTGRYQQNFAGLVGADAVIAGEAETLDGFEVLDDRTVQFTLNAPTAGFLASAIEQLKFLPKHLLEGKEISEEMPYSQAPIGTGRYKFVEWDKGSRFVMERNDDYWGDTACPRRITTVVIPDMQAITAALQAGDIDLSITIPPTEIPRLEEIEGLAVYEQPSRGAEALYFNLAHPALQDARVREAIAAAVDIEAFTENVLQGTTSPANSPFTNASWAWDQSDQQVAYNPERARALLTEAGYADGFQVDISTNQGNFFREVFVEFLQAELANVGIDATISKLEWGTFIGNAESRDYEMRFHVQDTGFPDPDSVYSVWHSEGANNWTGYSNPEVDAALEEARLATDLDVRRAAYQRVADLVNADLPAYFAFWRPNHLVTKDSYEGVVPSVLYNYGGIENWRLGSRSP